MTTNRLASPAEGKVRIVAPTDPKERERFWIDRGNRILWGQEPTSKGDYLYPRPELHWVCRSGNYSIEAR